MHPLLYGPVHVGARWLPSPSVSGRRGRSTRPVLCRRQYCPPPEFGVCYRALSCGVCLRPCVGTHRRRREAFPQTSRTTLVEWSTSMCTTDLSPRSIRRCGGRALKTTSLRPSLNGSRGRLWRSLVWRATRCARALDQTARTFQYPSRWPTTTSASGRS